MRSSFVIRHSKSIQKCERPNSMEGSVQSVVGRRGKGISSKLISSRTIVTLTLFFCTFIFVEQCSDVSVQGILSSITKDSRDLMRLLKDSNDFKDNASEATCKAELDLRKSHGTEILPRGIIQETSDLEPRPLWVVNSKDVAKTPTNLLAIAVGIRQKKNVDRIVEKFPADNFTVMLFHYDGEVDGWKDLAWSSRTIHVSVLKQTKWWFAKRFLHPDIVAAYNYIFIWDEDVGVVNFNARRYLEIVEKEGLDISQPALDPASEIHHPITVRITRNKVHRRMYKSRGSGLCFDNSTQPPCTGWVEMMVPVFSRSAWRCTWHMIQNDYVHSWGMDYKLGYCAQGDRSQRVGVVDKEYVVHHGIPSLGGSYGQMPTRESEQSSRRAIRKQSVSELEMFQRQWRQAVEEDKCWKDPYYS